jgi:hypothetical protein
MKIVEKFSEPDIYPQFRQTTQSLLSDLRIIEGAVVPNPHLMLNPVTTLSQIAESIKDQNLDLLFNSVADSQSQYVNSLAFKKNSPLLEISHPVVNKIASNIEGNINLSEDQVKEVLKFHPQLVDLLNQFSPNILKFLRQMTKNDKIRQLFKKQKSKYDVTVQQLIESSLHRD